MAVFSWWSDLSGKSDNERDLNLLNSTVHRVISGCVGLRFGVFGGCRSVVGGKDTS